MDIIKWSPFRDIDRLFEEEDFFSIIPSMSRKTGPAMDVYQTKDEVIAEVALAGVDPKNVKISVENDVLTVKGETKKEEETKEKDYYYKEIRSGSFIRSVSLPAHVKEDKAKAESRNGILKITIPKDEMKKMKEIPIKVSNKE